MTKSMKHPKTSKSKTKWIALGAALLAVLYMGGGLWLLSRTSNQSAAVAAVSTPTPETQPPSATPTVGSIPSAIPTVIIALNTPTAVPATPTADVQAATVTPSAGGDHTFAIVHSNDTWGYTMPCG